MNFSHKTISITRFATNPFALSNQEFGVEGMWVFINGAQSEWSLNHKQYTNGEVWYIGTIDTDSEVYDFMGNKTTPLNVYKSAIDRMISRNHFNLDHEDAGFYIPKTQFSNVELHKKHNE